LNKAETVEIQRLQCPACAAHLVIDNDGTVTAHAEEPAKVETSEDTAEVTTDETVESSETDQPVETEDITPEEPKKRSSRWSKPKK